jgi:hypothetical protein
MPIGIHEFRKLGNQAYDRTYITTNKNNNNDRSALAGKQISKQRKSLITTTRKDSSRHIDNNIAIREEFKASLEEEYGKEITDLVLQPKGIHKTAFDKAKRPLSSASIKKRIDEADEKFFKTAKGKAKYTRYCAKVANDLINNDLSRLELGDAKDDYRVGKVVHYLETLGGELEAAADRAFANADTDNVDDNAPPNAKGENRSDFRHGIILFQAAAFKVAQRMLQPHVRNPNDIKNRWGRMAEDQLSEMNDAWRTIAEEVFTAASDTFDYDQARDGFDDDALIALNPRPQAKASNDQVHATWKEVETKLGDLIRADESQAGDLQDWELIGHDHDPLLTDFVDQKIQETAISDAQQQADTARLDAAKQNALAQLNERRFLDKDSTVFQSAFIDALLEINIEQKRSANQDIEPLLAVANLGGFRDRIADQRFFVLSNPIMDDFRERAVTAAAYRLFIGKVDKLEPAQLAEITRESLKAALQAGGQ